MTKASNCPGLFEGFEKFEGVKWKDCCSLSNFSGCDVLGFPWIYWTWYILMGNFVRYYSVSGRNWIERKTLYNTFSENHRKINKQN